jgi:uncharacterized protein (DUF488 family)
MKNKMLARSVKTSELNIYTIGYQGRSIEEFKNLLIKKSIKTVIDVRNTPFSFKYGFIKNYLAKYLPESDIEYYSFPELGIEKKYRTEPTAFSYYATKLKSEKKAINTVAAIIQSKPSALMCFEADPLQCHRHILANTIQKLTSEEITHL